MKAAKGDVILNEVRYRKINISWSYLYVEAKKSEFTEAESFYNFGWLPRLRSDRNGEILGKRNKVCVIQEY